MRENNPYIVTFHATGLFEYEIEEIKKFGYWFKIPTQKFIEKRIRRMYKYMKFDDIIYSLLLEDSGIKIQNKNSKYYFVSSCYILSDMGFKDLYKYWGGELVYFRSKKSVHFRFDFKNTLPCLIVGLLRFDEINDNDLITKKIINYYVEQELGNSVSINDGLN